jgi:hypothetical protein
MEECRLYLLASLILIGLTVADTFQGAFSNNRLDRWSSSPQASFKKLIPIVDITTTCFFTRYCPTFPSPSGQDQARPRVRHAFLDVKLLLSGTSSTRRPGQPWAMAPFCWSKKTILDQGFLFLQTLDDENYPDKETILSAYGRGGRGSSRDGPRQSFSRQKDERSFDSGRRYDSAGRGQRGRDSQGDEWNDSRQREVGRRGEGARGGGGRPQSKYASYSGGRAAGPANTAAGSRGSSSGSSSPRGSTQARGGSVRRERRNTDGTAARGATKSSKEQQIESDSDDGEGVRVNKCFKEFASRRESDEFVREGRVKINGR